MKIKRTGDSRNSHNENFPFFLFFFFSFWDFLNKFLEGNRRCFKRFNCSTHCSGENVSQSCQVETSIRGKIRRKWLNETRWRRRCRRMQAARRLRGASLQRQYKMRERDRLLHVRVSSWLPQSWQVQLRRVERVCDRPSRVRRARYLRQHRRKLLLHLQGGLLRRWLHVQAYVSFLMLHYFINIYLLIYVYIILNIY